MKSTGILVKRVLMILAGLIIALVLLAATFGDYLMQRDCFRKARHVTTDAQNILGQYGLEFVLSKESLHWDWSIVDGFDLRYLRNSTDSNLYISYFVPRDQENSEIEFWKARSTSNEPVPWDSTSNPFVHAPGWWPKAGPMFLTVAKIGNANQAVVYYDQSSRQFFAFVNLLP
jgi:hypothetical protein